jgi:hypothetical protein
MEGLLTRRVFWPATTTSSSTAGDVTSLARANYSVDFPHATRSLATPPGASDTTRSTSSSPRATVQENKTMTATTPASSALVRPFTVAIADSEIDDLKQRLARTRWPDPETVPDGRKVSA